MNDRSDFSFDLLQKHFDTLIQTPASVKKLRELILSLAMQGRLVKQQPEEQPATELLKEIQTEKERQIKEGKIKPQKPLPPVKPDEAPYALPEGWVWCRLGDFIYLEMGQSPESASYNKAGNGLPFFQGKADFGQLYPTTRYWCTNPQKYAFPNDILLSVRAPVGPTNIANIKCCIGRGLSALRPLLGVPPKYVNYLMISFRSILESSATGTTFTAVSKSDVERLIIPLPPLAEQKRIVAKIDQLMELCDKLEQEIKKRDQKRIAAHKASLNRLLTASDKKEFDTAWQFIVHHFDSLYAVKENVSELKKAILSLAMQGRLVKQEPDDQPAIELLKEIQTEKERLIKEGKIKPQKPLPPIKPDEVPYALPEGWVWCRLGDAAIFINGDRSNRYPNENDLSNEGIPFFGAKDMVDGRLVFDNGLRFISRKKFKELSNGKLIHYDFVMLLRGTVGKTSIFIENQDFNTGFINAQMIIIRLINKELCPFFKSLFITKQFQYLINLKTTGSAIKQMPANVVPEFYIPLPPLAEQKRIVAKIDQLMELCNKLEQGIEKADEKQAGVLNAVLV